MSITNKKTLYVAAFLILLAVIWMQFYYLMVGDKPATINQPLHSAIPADASNWTSIEVPLAETKELLAKVSDILRFDDSLSRVYSNGQQNFMLYVGYWKSGTSTVKDVHSHTPDICWVKNGWEKLPGSKDKSGFINHFNFFPSQYRVFNKNGQVTYVHYWHIVSGKPHIEAGREFKKISFRTIRNFLKFGINQKKDQYFVRISSTKPFGQMDLENEGLQSLMTRLGELCIRRNDEEKSLDTDPS